jgi:hypothetical protein
LEHSFLTLGLAFSKTIALQSDAPAVLFGKCLVAVVCAQLNLEALHPVTHLPQTDAQMTGSRCAVVLMLSQRVQQNAALLLVQISREISGQKRWAFF